MMAKPAAADTKRVNLFLPDDVDERVARIAETDHRRSTDVLRFAIELGLDALEKRLGIARDARAADAIASGRHSRGAKRS